MSTLIYDCNDGGLDSESRVFAVINYSKRQRIVSNLHEKIVKFRDCWLNFGVTLHACMLIYIHKHLFARNVYLIHVLQITAFKVSKNTNLKQNIKKVSKTKLIQPIHYSITMFSGKVFTSQPFLVRFNSSIV